MPSSIARWMSTVKCAPHVGGRVRGLLRRMAFEQGNRRAAMALAKQKSRIGASG